MSHAHKNRFLIILILGSLSTLSPFAIDMYLPSFQDIAADLNTTTARVSLSVATYFAGLAAGQLIYGPLLDRFGRKRPLYFGLTIFIVASLLCLKAHSWKWLAAMRCLQALGGCAAQVDAMAMVRDFFPVHETARIISWLILILGVSPLLAPTAGVYISAHWGWHWIFIVLAIVAFLNLLICLFYLPQGHTPDPSVSLHPVPIMQNFLEVLRERQFLTFSVSGAVAFSGLLVYVAGAPLIFIDYFKVTKQTFGIIFAVLAMGFIGSNQVNVLLLRRFTSVQIFLGSLLVVCPVAVLFATGAWLGWFGLAPTLVLLFIALSSLGLAYPNAAALAISPFDRNIGSASAMLGFVQIAISGFAAASVGLFDSQKNQILPVAIILAVSSFVALGIFIYGKQRIGTLKFIEEKGATPLVH